MSGSEITVPCQWNLDKIKKIISYNKKKDIAIAEMYGALSNGETPQGRELSVAHQSDRENALTVKRYLEQNGIAFAYLINTPIKLKSYKNLEEELNWIINVFKADSLTVCSLELMEVIRRQYPKAKINVSTIAGVKTIKDIEKYLHVNPQKVITHHDLNRNYEDLKMMVSFLKIRDMDLEIMVNESCLRRCNFREDHYRILGEGGSDRKFHETCNMIKIINPYQLLMANFIRPEDLGIYEEMGVTMFKITGRSKPMDWLEEVVQGYLNREYKGNLYRLLGTDPLLEIERKVLINNKALDGFLAEYTRSDDTNMERKYCEDWILKLYQNHDFYIDNVSVEPFLADGRLRYRFINDDSEKLELYA